MAFENAEYRSLSALEEQPRQQRTCGRAADQPAARRQPRRRRRAHGRDDAAAQRQPGAGEALLQASGHPGRAGRAGQAGARGRRRRGGAAGRAKGRRWRHNGRRRRLPRADQSPAGAREVACPRARTARAPGAGPDPGRRGAARPRGRATTRHGLGRAARPRCCSTPSAATPRHSTSRRRGHGRSSHLGAPYYILYG